jgi:hypothetical protein
MNHPNVLKYLTVPMLEKKQQISLVKNYSTKNSIEPIFPILKGTGQGHAYHLVDSSP